MSARLYGKKVIGICTCGHPQWMHNECVQMGINDQRHPSGIAVRTEGHGECEAACPIQTDGDEDTAELNKKESTKCPCKQFTWHHNEVNPHPSIDGN